MAKLPAFTDVQSVMDTAAQSEKGIRYRVTSWGLAVNFRQRCYRFRVKQQEIAREAYGLVPGFIPQTPYDGLELWIEDSFRNKLRKKPKETHKHYDVVIRHRVSEGHILNLETDEPIDLQAPAASSLELDE